MWTPVPVNINIVAAGKLGRRERGWWGEKNGWMSQGRQGETDGWRERAYGKLWMSIRSP